MPKKYIKAECTPEEWAAHLERVRRGRHRRRAAAPPPAPKECQGCGAALGTTHHLAKWCESCRVEALRAASLKCVQKKRPPKSIICIDCGGPREPNGRTKGRCAACKRDAELKQQRARAARRRYELQAAFPDGSASSSQPPEHVERQRQRHLRHYAKNAEKIRARARDFAARNPRRRAERLAEARRILAERGAAVAALLAALAELE